ncbi:MAG: rhodanese-like domain-containing protein [Candidatus Acidiferrales bacterium]
MKASVAVVALLFALSFSASALRAQDDVGPVDPAMAMSAAAPVPTVTPADVMQLMQQKDANVVLVDTQPVSGYADTHIPGAVNYPWVMRIAKFPITLPRDKTLIFYGSCPNDTSGIVKQLAEYGYFNVKIMDGGLYKWEGLKYPVVRANGSDSDLSQASTHPSNHGN